MYHCHHDQRRRLEIEKEELQSALEEAEAALEQEENKVIILLVVIGCHEKRRVSSKSDTIYAGDACPAGLGSGEAGDRQEDPGEGGGVREHQVGI